MYSYKSNEVMTVIISMMMQVQSTSVTGIKATFTDIMPTSNGQAIVTGTAFVKAERGIESLVANSVHNVQAEIGFKHGRVQCDVVRYVFQLIYIND
jgi:hypothetical protein